MPAVRNPNRDDHTPVDVHAELDRIRLERNAREAHDRAASERAARSEANDRAAELQRQRLATLTPFNQLIGAEGEEVLAAFERELKERKWNAMLARHIILPHLRRRGDGEMFVAYEDWDASVGAAVTSLMPLADAGLLLSEQSPALLVPKKKLAWEKVQAERRAAEEQQRRLQESSRRLDARRAAKAKEVRDLGQARAALILTAHELEQRQQPELAATFRRFGEILGADDQTLSALLNRYAQAVITDEDPQHVAACIVKEQIA